MEYKRYEQYKDSGIEWVGDIPEGWAVKKIKYLVNRIQTGTTPTTQRKDYFEGEVNWFTPADFDEQLLLTSSKRKISIEAIANNEAKAFSKDTVLIVGIGATLGKVGIINCESSFNQQITGFLINKKEILPKLFLYWLSSITSYINNIANYTTLPIINNQALKEIPCIVPAFEEQKRVVNYIETKTASIDDLIAEKEKLIELLQEQRQAIITEAVTKGLNQNVKMKDSGIEWIGEIPEHWKIKRLKNMVRLNPSKQEIRNLPQKTEVTFIPMEKIISTGNIDYTMTNTIETLINGYTYFSDGDIILAKVTPCFENGNIGIVEGLCNGVGFGTTELHVIRCTHDSYNKYLFYFLQSRIFKSQAVSAMYGVAGLKRIPTDFISTFKFGFPDINEQIKIADYLDEQIRDTNSIVDSILCQIQNMKDYRQSLISEAVTGKIDVRGYSA